MLAKADRACETRSKMPAFIDHILSRRSRRNTHETQLNSVWGDMRITSPTDSVKVCEGKDHGISVNTAEPQLSNSEHGTPLTGGIPSRSPSFTAMPFRNGKNNYNSANIYSEHTTFTAGLPSPRHTPLLPHSQFGLGMQQVSETPTSPKSPQTILEDALKDKGYYANALAVYGISTPFDREEDSVPSTQRRSGYSQTISPINTDQHDERVVYISNRRPLSPTEIAALIQRPKRPDRLHNENIPTNKHSQFSSLNAATIESVHSPIVTILSPVSEGFGLEGHGSPIDDIKIVPDNIHNNVQHSSKREPLGANLTTVSLPSQPSQKGIALGSNSPPQQILYNKNTIMPPSNPLTSNPTLCSRSPSIGGDRTVSTGLVNESSKAITKPTKVKAHTVWTNNTVDHASTLSSTMSRQIDHDLPHVRSPSFSESNRTQSPRLGVTEVMRMRSPPLGSTARMRVQSPPLGVGTDKAMQVRRLSNEVANIPHSASPVNREITMTVPSRQRSNSLEPPASPSYFQTETPSTLSSTVNSDLAVTHILLPADLRHGRSDTDPTAPIQSEFPKDEIPPLLKRSRSQVTLTSPDLRKRHAFSGSPILTFETKISKPSTQGLYAEITDDYRLLSREAFVAKYAATSGTVSSSTARRKQHPRARSVSRTRDKSMQGLPSQEVPATTERKSLVPTYEEMWT